MVVAPAVVSLAAASVVIAAMTVVAVAIIAVAVTIAPIVAVVTSAVAMAVAAMAIVVVAPATVIGVVSILTAVVRISAMPAIICKCIRMTAGASEGEDDRGNRNRQPAEPAVSVRNFGFGSDHESAQGVRCPFPKVSIFRSPGNRVN